MENHFPAIVGQWSLGRSDGSFNGLTNFQIDHVMPSWDFRACVERGWLPSHFEQEDA